MWKTTGGAVRGTGHERTGIPCQDKTYSMTLGDTVTAALADGAGSACLSHYGAEAVTESACSLLCDSFERFYAEENGLTVKQELMDSLLTRLDTLSSGLECARQELASTLLAVSVKDDRFILVHLGDGVIGYLKDGELKVASSPINGEFANETVFTTSADAMKALKLVKGRLDGIAGFVMMSDGSETGLYSKREKRLVNGLRKVLLYCALHTDAEAAEYVSGCLEGTLKKCTADDCSLMVLEDPLKTSGQLLTDDMTRKGICGIRNRRTLTSRSRLRFYDGLMAYISEPKSTIQISRRFHIGRNAVRKRMRRLECRGLVRSSNGMFVRTISR